MGARLTGFDSPFPSGLFKYLIFFQDPALNLDLKPEIG